MAEPDTSAGVLKRAGCPVHYRLTGPEDAPPVVLCHGAMMDHRMFDAQVSALAGRYRVLTWDLRGHGLSRPINADGANLLMRDLVDDLVAILDLLGYERVALVGQSLGGHVAQEMVFLHPERITALATVGASCSTIKHPRLDRLALRLTPAMLKLWPYDDLRKRIAEGVTVRPDVEEYAYETTSRIPKDDLLRIWNAVVDGIHHEPGYRIEHPLLITHGDKDALGNIKKISPRWAARDPRSRYVVIPDASHNANQDNPDFFNRQLRYFLDTFAPPGKRETTRTQTGGT